MKGIAIAGTILVDKINEISAYPKAGELTKIVGIQQAVGGCVPNVGIDIKLMSKQTDVYAIAKVGVDDDAAFLRKELSSRGVDITGLTESKNARTSFTEVMSVSGGQRTFFTHAGASAEFGYDDIDFENFKAEMLHLGYFLLLDKVDNGDGLKILKQAKAQGIKTSIDLVSENSDRYKVVIPCLPYTDNVIINETEAGRIADIEPTKDNLRAIAEKIRAYGVKERVIIHMPEVGVCLSDEGFTIVPSFSLPKDYIKGTTGAGDAFCAGALLGIYEGKSDKEILEFASMAAVAALGAPDAIGGMKSADEIKELCKNLERKELCW